MKLDYQEIHHIYIIKLIIFSVFLFKEYRKNEKVYTDFVNRYVSKRIHYKIKIELEVGPKLSISEKRESQIDSILENENTQYLNMVYLSFKTGFKDKVRLQIDLNNEDTYESFLYL